MVVEISGIQLAATSANRMVPITLVDRVGAIRAQNVSELMPFGNARNVLREIEVGARAEELDLRLYSGIENFIKGDPISLFFAFMNLQYVQKTSGKSSVHYRTADNYLRRIPAQVKEYEFSSD